MGVVELYEEKLKKEKSEGKKTPYYGVKNLYYSSTVEDVAKDIVNRTNNWLKNNSNYVDNYRTRYSGNNETYKKDADDWLSTVTTQNQNFISEANSLKSLLSEYNDYLDPEFVKQITDALDGNLDVQSKIVENVTLDRDYWKQWDSEASYNQWHANEKSKQLIMGEDGFEDYYKAGEQQGLGTHKAWFGIDGTKQTIGSDVNDYLIAFRNNRSANGVPVAIAIGAGSGGGLSFYAGHKREIDAAQYMTDDEYKIYCYYIGKGETAKANGYLISLDDTIAQRKGGAIAQMYKDNNLEWLAWLPVGVDQWASGVKNLDNFIMGTEADPTTAIQYAGSIIREDIDSKFWQGAWDLGVTTSNMLPSILVGSVTGGAGGLATMGASVLGNSYAEMRNLGYNEWQARGYATLVTAAEVGLQYVLGGYTKLGGKLSNGIVEGFASGVDNAIAKIAIRYGGKMISEGFEESLQSVLEPMFKSWMSGEKYDVDWNEVMYSGILGALSAGVLESVPSVVGGSIDAVQTNKLGKNFKQNGDVNRLATYVKEHGDTTFAASSVANRLAGKVNENTNAYKLGLLLKEVNGVITEQNKADIVKSLERKGIRTKDAKKLADTLAAVAAGYELTTEQQLAFNADERVSKTMKAVIYNENSTVKQRIAGYNEAIKMVKAENASKTAEGAKVIDSSVEGNIVSEDGSKEVSEARTTYNGEAVEIAGVSSIKDGNVIVRLDNGSEVNVRDVDFKNEKEALVYEAVANMNEKTAIDFIDGFNNGNIGNGQSISFEQYLRGFNEAYMNGLVGMPANYVSKGGFAIELSEEQRKLAYQRGRIDGTTKVENQQKAKDEQRATVSKTENIEKKKGKVFYDSINKKTLTSRQKASIKALEKVAEALGIDIHLFESEVNEKGEHIGENGSYDPTTNTIRIDIHAGVKGEGLMLFTAAHELTHFIKEWSPAKFKVFADFLLEQYATRGVPVETLIQDQIKKGKKRWEGKTEAEIYELAYEELIADSCEAMLTDSNALEKLALLRAEDKGLFNKIKNFILDLVAKIKKVYKGLKPDSEEANYVRDMVDAAEKLQQMWTEALLDAGEAYGTITSASSTTETLKAAGVEVDSNSGSATMMSVRHVPTTDEEVNKVAKALVEAVGVSFDKAKNWVKSETSLASIILDPSKSAYLDYEADDRYEMIKKNADYPQGTVDASNLCKKRQEFTALYDRLQKEFPNRIISASDLEKIRQILIEEGVEVACGLCYVEERRQLLGEIAQGFIDGYKNGTLKDNIAKELDAKDSYVPTIYDLITYDGYRTLSVEHPSIAQAFKKFNNARGMQAGRLIEGKAEYKREILSWNKKKVDFVNSVGGLRIFSFSDFEAHHLIDIVQIIQDCAVKGVMIQGYTKVPAFANAVKDTNVKINRSLIAKGTGVKIENGKKVLDLDPVEGINFNDKDFFDSTDSESVGNVLVGMGDEQIRLAMVSPLVDYIIPFHTGLKKDILKQKKIDGWENYKNYQTDKNLSDGKVAKQQINIYTDVLQVAETEGKPIKNKKEFVNKFLAVAKEKGVKPRFWNFLETDAQGNYVYTEGYHKFLVDFKLFDKNGNILPQKPVVPVFDDALNARILNEYVEGKKNPVSRDKVYKRLVDEVVKVETKYSDREVTEISSQEYREMYNHFGATNNYNVAGYMLKNGIMLDFSGKHWGDDYSTTRQVDHRDISEIYHVDKSDNGVGEMINMISNGNIRLMPETGGINLAVMPNESQINQLRGYINHFRGEIVIDIDAIGGDTIHSWEYNRGTSSSKILSDIKAYFENGTIPQQQSSFNQFRYSDRVTDKKTLDFLENQEHVTVYRAMQLIDGKLYPPMNAYTYDKNGKKVLVTASEIGAWEQAVERPDLIDPKTGKFKLDKGKVDGGKRGTIVPAAYNPYIHTSLSMLNDQFTSAYTRSNLVVVKGVVPKSELSSGYKAQYAKDSVGETEWHSGVVSTQLPESRKVILSRWFKPVEIVDNDVVAQNIKEMLGETGIEIPYNVVSPKLRRSLEKIGVPIGEGRGIRNLPSKNEVMYSFREYTDKQKENWKSSKRILLYDNEAQYRDFIKESRTNNLYNKKLYFGAITSELAALIKSNTGIDVEGFNCTLSAYEIRKMFKDHGNEQAENLRGQRAITEEDILNIPRVILSPSAIKKSPKLYNGKPVINFTKDINGKITVSAVVSDKHLDLFVQTAFVGIKKGNLATPIDEQASINTPKASSGTVSDKIVPQKTESVNTNPKISQKLSDRDTDSMSNRSLLANALEVTVQNDIEKIKLETYKQKIALLNAEERKLQNINKQIRDISFSEGARDNAKLKDLKFEANQIANRINTYDRQLLNLEASKPLKNVLEREKKKAYKKAEQRGKEALDAYRERSAKTTRELMNRYQESRSKATEGRHKTEMRGKIKKVVGELNKLLRNGTKERNVKIELQETVSKALDLADLLLSEEYTNEVIARHGVESVTDAEQNLLKQYNSLLDTLEPYKARLESLYEERKELNKLVYNLKNNGGDKAEIDSANAKIDDINKKIEDIRNDAEYAKASRRLSKLNADLSDVFIRERNRYDKAKAASVMEALIQAYNSLKGSETDYIRNAYQKELSDRLESISENFGNVSIKDMSLKDLESIYKAYVMVKHVVTDANTLFRNGRKEDLGERIDAVQFALRDMYKEHKDRLEFLEGIISKIRAFSWNNLRPIDAFERLGVESFKELFWDAVKAQDTYARDIVEAGEVIAKARADYGYKKWDLKTATTFKTINDLYFKLTLGDMMSIYAYSFREQAYDHMTKGGFTFDTGKTYKEKKGGLTYRHAKLSDTYIVSDEVIQAVIETLTPEQKAYVETVQKYLTTIGEKGNEVARILYGIDIFTDQNYFPLQSETDYRSSVEEALNGTQTMVSLKNTGMTKETKPHASNPIVLKSFDDVVMEHIDKMAKYHAYVIPIENLQKVFNNASQSISHDPVSTKRLISSIFGDEARDYFKQYITDLNGGSSISGAKNPLAGFFSKAKGVAVAANLSVVAQQYFAVIRAMTEVDAKYFVPFLNRNASKSEGSIYEELKKYAPVAIIKEMGGFDIGSNRGAMDYIGSENAPIDRQYVQKKFQDATMFGASLMDKLGWVTIWKAVKKEVSSTRPELTVGSEEFLNACGERFTEVVTKTQVYDSVNTRSGYMRSKHDSVKYLTSFMGEPTVSIGMYFTATNNLIRALGTKDRAQISKALKKFARTAATLPVAGALTAMAKALIQAMRDDDEDESYIEKWVEHYTANFKEDLNPLNYLPVFRDIVSVWEGWDVERPDMTLIADLITSAKNMFDEDATAEDTLNALGAFANLLGIPLKNVIKDARGFINTVKTVSQGEKTTSAGIKEALKKGWTGEKTSNAQQLYEAILSGDQAQIDRVKGRFEDQDAINAAIIKALRENDSRIREAAQARYNGDIATYMRIAKEIIAEGYFDQDTVVAAINAEINAIKREEAEGTTKESTEDKADEVTSIYSASDVNAAFENGDTAMAKEVITDLVNTKMANGKTEKEAKASIRSSMTAYWKPLYKAAYQNNDTAETERIRKILYASGLYGGVNDVIETAKSWLKD